MSAENIKRVITAIRENPDIKEKILQSKSLQEVTDILAASDYTIKSEDIVMALHTHMRKLDNTNEELELLGKQDTIAFVILLFVIIG